MMMMMNGPLMAQTQISDAGSGSGACPPEPADGTAVADAHTDMHSPIAAADARVEAELSAALASFGLSPFGVASARSWLGRACASPAARAATARVRGWLLSLLNHAERRRAAVPRLQRGCPEIIPGLRARPWWDPSDLPWLAGARSVPAVLLSCVC